MLTWGQVAIQTVQQKAEAVHAIIMILKGPGEVPLSKLKHVIRMVTESRSAPAVNGVLQAMDDYGMITWDKTNTGKKEKLVPVHSLGATLQEVPKDWVTRVQAALPGLRL